MTKRLSEAEYILSIFCFLLRISDRKLERQLFDSDKLGSIYGMLHTNVALVCVCVCDCVFPLASKHSLCYLSLYLSSVHCSLHRDQL